MAGPVILGAPADGGHFPFGDSLGGAAAFGIFAKLYLDKDQDIFIKGNQVYFASSVGFIIFVQKPQTLSLQVVGSQFLTYIACFSFVFFDFHIFLSGLWPVKWGLF